MGCTTGWITGNARLGDKFSFVVIKALYTFGVRNNPHSQIANERLTK